MKRLVLILVLFTAFASALTSVAAADLSTQKEAISHEDRTELFQNGVKAYDRGDYDVAVQSFESVLKMGFKNGYVYYNLANSYFRSGQLGNAIANYLRAKAYLPRHSDLKNNLRYAREKTRDRIDPTQWVGLRRTFLAPVNFLSGREWLWVFVVANVCFLVVFWVWQRRPNETWNWLMGFSMGLTALSLCAVSMRFFFNPTIGVVTEPQISVFSGPKDTNTELFVLHEGCEFRVRDRERDWLRLRLADGKEGWVASRFVDTFTP